MIRNGVCCVITRLFLKHTDLNITEFYECSGIVEMS